MTDTPRLQSSSRGDGGGCSRRFMVALEWKTDLGRWASVSSGSSLFLGLPPASQSPFLDVRVSRPPLVLWSWLLCAWGGRLCACGVSCVPGLKGGSRCDAVFYAKKFAFVSYINKNNSIGVKISLWSPFKILKRWKSLWVKYCMKNQSEWV